MGKETLRYGLTYRIFVIWHLLVFGMLLVLLSRTLDGITLPPMMESCSALHHYLDRP